jgi:hypothetical protein
VATAKVFQSGNGLAVCLLEECRLKDKEWEIFMRGINGFSDDYNVEHLNDVSI